MPSLKQFGPDFLWTKVWSVPDDEYGALISTYGTVVTSIIALIIAVPVSFGIALFLTETCPIWMRRPLGTAIELLAGVPSIIYGIWGLFVFAPLFATHVQPHLQSALGDVPIIGDWFAGPPIGVGLRCGLHDLGSRLEHRAALYPRWGDRRHYAWARPRAGRNHGGYFCDR